MRVADTDQPFVVDSSFNKVTISLEFPVDKWRGLNEWQETTDLLVQLAAKLFEDSRGHVYLTREIVPFEED